MFLILKIGGSLFSDKKLNRDIDLDAVDKLARLVAELYHSAPGHIALILGGGSYGHGAVRAADLSDRLGILDLTEANFTQKWIWIKALRSRGVSAIPFQLTSFCMFQNGSLVVENNVLKKTLLAGILPVLTGDCLLDSNGELKVFGSDRVPEILLNVTSEPVRIVALTDTSGVICKKEEKIISYVNPDADEEIYKSIWLSPEYNTTGAMYGKLKSFINFAKQNAECFIMKGDLNVESLKFLFECHDKWSTKLLYTRIAFDAQDFS